MRTTIVILAILLLAGCAGFPPKPPAVEGEYRPVNQLNTKHQENGKTDTPRYSTSFMRGILSMHSGNYERCNHN